MNSGLKESGFTIIETLVVCVIVGILAAVAIPQYIGYVNAQRQTTVDNLAETAAASANAYFRRTGADPDSAALGLYIASGSGYSVKVNPGATPKNVTVSKGSYSSAKSY
jgi:prepilin-type N-terminal cleavage/methylation domain-containing protein